jgi:hypothetical protein
MDAVTDNIYKVFFGGRYMEDWTEDYKLTIRYENRREVLAKKQDGQWVPAGGDEQICALLVW